VCRRADYEMPLRESEAIVLRSFPMGEADRLVSFLCRTSGRLRGVARGARRPKSRFGSTLETMSHIRVWYYERETRDLVRIGQCELVESFFAAQKDYASTMALALVSEVTESVVPEHEAADPVFRLILITARTIQAGSGVWLPVAYFLLWMVRLAGWLPKLNQCQNCGKAFGEADAFEMMHGELVCRDCRIGGKAIAGEVLKLGQKISTSKLEEILALKPSVTQLKQLSRYMLDVIERETERNMGTWKLLEEAP